MKLGYPCLGSNLPWQGSKTFRLASYSPERLHEAVQYNISTLEKTLEWNRSQGLLFFRISSDLVPFASHPVNQYPWADVFAGQFRRIGQWIRGHDMRMSMHPDQFVLINSPTEDIFQRSVAELEYHARVLDAFGLDQTHKMQIHVGGVYGDKEASIQRFIERYALLSPEVKRRLVIENDDRLYTFADCQRLHEATGVPILFDSFHHELNNDGTSLRDTFPQFLATWAPQDGVPMMDYSSQECGKRVGTHCTAIDLNDFRRVLALADGYDFDLMLEIKNKELSACEAYPVLAEFGRHR